MDANMIFNIFVFTSRFYGSSSLPPALQARDVGKPLAILQATASIPTALAAFCQ
jgi:hypothetical protein